MNLFRSIVAVAALLPMVYARAQTTDSVVARVQDEIITSFAVYEESARQEKILRDKLVGKELDEALATLRSQTAVQLIEQELIYAEFQALGGQLPATLVQQRVDRFVKAQADGDRAKFEALVESRGLTMTEFEDKVRRALAIELLIREKIGRNIDISPARVKAYYEAHRDELHVPEQVRFQMIAIKSNGKYEGKQDATAKKVLAELAAGKAFGDVAREWSEGAYAQVGGDHDWAPTTNYEGALRDALAELEPGTYTKEPLTVGSTAVIVRLVERRGGHVLPLDADLQQKIEEKLGKDEEKDRYRAFINELRKKYFVKVFDRELATYWDSL